MKSIIGDIIRSDAARTRKARIHQGWWRAFVLGEPPGPRPNNQEERVCNTVECDENYGGNFLTPEIAGVVNEVLHDRKTDAPGLIQESRLRGNLLSSQPLCFNFFGFLYKDKELARKVLSSFYPEIIEVKSVLFEYAPTPKRDYTNDNSAFDIAIEVRTNGGLGLIGVECKYTESFSPTEYRTDRYREIYDNSDSFSGSYESLTSSRFNQLFRNQLIAEALVQQSRYDFVHTALFCSPDDQSARKIGKQFKSLLNNQCSNFKIITFFDFIESIQKKDVSPEQREYSMLLWARYMAHALSGKAKEQYDQTG